VKEYIKSFLFQCIRQNSLSKEEHRKRTVKKTAWLASGRNPDTHGRPPLLSVGTKSMQPLYQEDPWDITKMSQDTMITFQKY
jgi:hypothetical protein